MAVKMKKPDYWPALEEGERLAGIQRERDARRRSIINKEDCIRIRGANEHNLKNLTLEIPRNELVVLTGLSGSGKSSLAFDTIYAEGQRRYREDTWNLCLLMRDSSWDRWRNRTWRRSRDCPRRSP